MLGCAGFYAGLTMHFSVVARELCAYGGYGTSAPSQWVECFAAASALQLRASGTCAIRGECVLVESSLFLLLVFSVSFIIFFLIIS